MFSNEIDTAATPLKGLEPGCDIVLESHDGRFLAHAYVNPASLIAARVTSSRRDRPFDRSLLHQRLQSALALRNRLYPKPFYRWVHGEGDRLPGLVVDRYDDVLVVQINSAGMECRRKALIESLVELCQPRAIQLRGDTVSRTLEGLPAQREWVVGSESPLHVHENGLDFEVPTGEGQKTGWFYDHRDTRLRLRRYVEDARVLDLYTYLGGFAVNAAVGGAREVVAIDRSAEAIAGARRNVEASDVAGTVVCRESDAIAALKSYDAANDRFDVIVLDPPAFIKRRKDLKAGSQHYALTNRLALRLLKPGGILFSASCSQHFDEASLLRALRDGVPRDSVGLQVVEMLQQGADHPVHPSMPETRYLKGFAARLLPA